MRIKLNKKYTEGHQIERVKEDIKEFKEMYTEADLLNAFREQTNYYKNYCADIIKLDIEAFDAGTHYDELTTFMVFMILDGINEMTKIRFYADKNLNIHENLVNINEYKLA